MTTVKYETTFNAELEQLGITEESLLSTFEEIGLTLMGLPMFQMSCTPAEAATLNILAGNPVSHGLTVELGACYGASTVPLALGCKRVGQVMCSVDTWRGTTFKNHWQWNPGTDCFPVWQAIVVHNQVQQTVVPLRGFFQDVVKAWAAPIRLLYIDGYHTYAAAKEDFESWSPFVHPGGLVLFHDYKETPKLECEDFIDELAASESRFVFLGHVERIAIFKASIDVLGGLEVAR